MEQVVEFATDRIPERDRVAFWREHYGQVMLRVDMEPTPGTVFNARIRSLSLPGLQLMEASSSPVKISRSGQYLADGNDDILLAINKVGSVVVASGGREQNLREGEAILLSGADAFSFHRTGAGHSFTMRVPRAIFESATGGVNDALMRPIQGDRGSLTLLSGYAGWLLHQPGATDQQLLEPSVRDIHGLLAQTLDPAAEFGEPSRTHGLRAARLKFAKSYVVAYSNCHQLSVASVAKRLDVSPRYVQRLFEAEGTTFSEFLASRRLARAHQLLRDAGSGQTISTIAHGVGFGDLSYFNRRFRRQFGMTPREVRGERSVTVVSQEFA
jgi:AraC-like DNA-binding protein